MKEISLDSSLDMSSILGRDVDVASRDKTQEAMSITWQALGKGSGDTAKNSRTPKKALISMGVVLLRGNELCENVKNSLSFRYNENENNHLVDEIIALS